MQGPLACPVLTGCADGVPLMPPWCWTMHPQNHLCLPPIRASMQLVPYGRGLPFLGLPHFEHPGTCVRGVYAIESMLVK